MRFSNQHIQALRNLGYTEREAQFLYIVAIHSGYFTQGQLCHFLGNKSGRAARSFTLRLLSHKHARDRKYQNNAHIYHLAHRRIYQAIERENLRNRRIHTFEFMKTRLAILDFVLGHLQHDYFEGEAQKVQYFEERLHIRPQDMPGRTYRGANKVPDTIRHFVDKFPLFLASTVASEPRLTLSFIDPGFGNLEAFKTHVSTYATFLGRIPQFAFLFASPHARFFEAAESHFKEVTNPQPGKLSEQVARYFELRLSWEAKEYELLKDPDIEFMNHARKCFAGEAFESAFKDWKARRLTQRDLIAVLENRARHIQEIEFNTCLLPRDYSSFGQNSAVTGKPL